MKVIRRIGVFETNSSSTHSLTMCSKEEYEKWVSGEILLDMYSGKFLPVSEMDEEIDGEYYKDGERYYNMSEYWDHVDMETFEQEYTTKTGEVVVAFGYYGRED